MARGMAAGERIVSQAQTDKSRAEYERIFGDRKPQRGRWVWDERANEGKGGLVSADEYVAPTRALNAPFMVDRYMEGVHFDDGERVRDIGSRKKRRAFLAEKGWADRGDFSPQYLEQAKASREREFGQRIRDAREKAARKLYREGKWE